MKPLAWFFFTRFHWILEDEEQKSGDIIAGKKSSLDIRRHKIEPFHFEKVTIRFF